MDMHNCHSVYLHCLKVGNYAYYLSKKYLEQPQKAQIAGLLHDVSAVYPNGKRIEVANKMKIHLCKEEKDFPMIIHQKLSKEMAKTKFGISDEEVLSAIECHTTLKPNYSKLDLVLFVADKIKWDQSGTPPYLEGLMNALDTSLEAAAYYYINYILNNDIIVPHPWLLAAYKELENYD
ncbi:bis(5'-nucleosyl)-tetraphosphatase (symmetrical) YqeK [Enterococcus gilvus]|uniref:bis(5'-nucleosyl)-tetraphosphatase (symmetrical) YqeK n=1 Tax=Enterococcus gilvus TaxID=160453 RepID=UPI003ED85153